MKDVAFAVLTKKGNNLDYSADIRDIDKLADGKHNLYLAAPTPPIEASESVTQALRLAIDTLAVGRHLLYRHCPDHDWLPKFNENIEKLKALIPNTEADK